jgi:hypothetical protein
MTQMVVGFRCDFTRIAGWLAASGLCACSEPIPAPTPPTQFPVPERTLAVPALDELRALQLQDLSGALTRMDECVGAYSANAEFWQLYGETMLTLFETELAAGRTIAYLPEDAAACFDTAISLTATGDATGAQIGLAHALRLANDPEGAWAAAQAALEGGGALEDAQREEIGRAGLVHVIARLQEGEPAPASAEGAARALAVALAAGRASAAVPLFDLHAWLGQWEAAADAALRGLLTLPPADDLLARLRSLGSAQRNLHVATLEEARRARADDGAVLWFLGEALFFQGREARSANDTLKAAECFDRADECFTQAQSARPDFAGSCREWLHLIRVQRAWTLRDEGRTALAADAAIAALAAAPERLEAAPTPDTLRLAVEAVAADFFRAEDLAGARDFLRRVCALHDADADWLNNLGFFCRELGVAAGERGDAAGAGILFEESWSAYSRAAELAPEDARIINDRALIAVYYLDEHWDLAERELHRSIEVGTRQLAEMRSDVPEQEHRYVDEAVGDAWENLAYLQLVRRQRTEGVEEFLDESVKHLPFSLRGGVARLRELLAEAQRQP